MPHGKDRSRDKCESQPQWPLDMKRRVDIKLAELLKNCRSINDPPLRQLAEEAAHDAILLWTGRIDEEQVNASCEDLLCVVDVLMDHTDLQNVPRDHWPIQVQLLGLLASIESEDASFVHLAASKVGTFLGSDSTVLGKKNPHIQRLVPLLLSWSTLVALRTGEIRTLATLHARIEEAVTSGPAPVPRDPKRRRVKREAAEAGIAEAAADALRNIAWQLTQVAFDEPCESESISGRGSISLPPLEVVRQVTAEPQTKFPFSKQWLYDSIVDSSLAIASA